MLTRGSVLTFAALSLMAGCLPADPAGPAVSGPKPADTSRSVDAGRLADAAISAGDAASVDVPAPAIDKPDAASAGVDAPAAGPDAAAAADATTEAPPADAPGGNQGPVAEGRIVFNQDFESGMAGITRSPTNLPADRADIADDPLGQRGKVMKIVYRMGDGFQTNGGSTHTRSFISNTGYSFPVGSTVHYAWGYMTASQDIHAAFGQVIRPGGPMWLIEGRSAGEIYVNCRSCGGKVDLPVRFEPNRWYDIRVEMTYSNGGPIRFFVDGRLVLERRMSVNDPAGQRAHWDGGIYNHAEGTSTRTVYISNLSVGLK